MKYLVERTFSAFGDNSQVPEREWQWVSTHRTREAAQRRLGKEKSEMRRWTGPTAWNGNFRIRTE